MRYIKVLGSCLVVALMASACSQQNATKDVGPEDPGDPVETIEASTVDANTVLANALAQAKSDDKNVFIHLGAPW